MSNFTGLFKSHWNTFLLPSHIFIYIFVSMSCLYIMCMFVLWIIYILYLYKSSVLAHFRHGSPSPLESQSSAVRDLLQVPSLFKIKSSIIISWE
jgi:thiosulfate reductase cytochrome b subunit